MEIAANCVVAFHYQLKNDSGETIDSSEGKEPLKYLHGAGGIIPGLEKELAGKTSGDSLNVTVGPEEGYGQYNEALIQKLPKETFAEVENIAEGMQFQMKDPEGHIHQIRVDKVEDDGVVVNGNHPLAGQNLNFDVTIESVREATPEEIDHGHVH